MRKTAIDSSIDYRYEQNRDYDGRFFAVHYLSHGLLPQFHACIEIFALIKGKITAVVNNHSYELESGSILLINSFEIHSYTTEGEAEVACLLIGNECVSDFLVDFRDHEFTSVFADKERSREIIDIIVNAEKNQRSYDLYEQKAYANLVLSRIIKGGGVRPKPWANNVKISAIIRYIYDNYEGDISLNKIAEAFNYAPMSVSHMFSRHVGMDIRCFVNDLRAQKAHRMINDERYSNLSILAIATECGFNSSATFYRSYKRRYGVTPRR